MEITKMKAGGAIIAVLLWIGITYANNSKAGSYRF